MIRHGYKDKTGDETESENQIIGNLAEFIKTEYFAPWIPSSSEIVVDGRMTVMGSVTSSFASINSLSLSSLLESTCSERPARLTMSTVSNGESLEVSS